MKLKVMVYPDDPGYGAACPALSGCFTCGTTKDETLENIRDAIREYLEVVDEENADPDGE